MPAVLFDLDVDEIHYRPQRALPAQSRIQQKSVLLIEDSEEAMWLVRFALQEWGRGLYRLVWADHLGAGLDRLAAGGIDVVLLDLGLPESSGLESHAWVRELAPRVPLVVFTGDQRTETQEAISANGVEGYLVKDQVSNAQLVEAIGAALSASGKDRRVHWPERDGPSPIPPTE